ncbi:hypothetical protein [Microbulbifer aestuariivivens]|uniref:hypothetical protein n=1 Tax=Microbulbifer aestuariivivens TaxID=1908308 RepID=UPI0031EAA851
MAKFSSRLGGVNIVAGAARDSAQVGQSNPLPAGLPQKQDSGENFSPGKQIFHENIAQDHQHHDPG